MTQHRLKCWPSYFQAAIEGEKTFELRLNDRHFQVGDEIILEEWNPVTRSYTGRKSNSFVVSYVLNLKQYADVKGLGWKIARWLMPDLAILGLIQWDNYFLAEIDAYR